MIIADTSGLLAFYNEREPHHSAIRKLVEADNDLLVVSPYVVAELDYLIATRLGFEAELTVLRELAGGAYELAQLDGDDVGSCADLVERYSDQNIGITDASIVVLAKRYATRRILTLDRRHFGIIRPLTGGRFSLIGG